MSLNREQLFKKEISSPDDFNDCTEPFEKNLGAKTCVLLVGDLAAGKTTFVQKFCEKYNLLNVASPTYALHHVYQNEQIKIHHFDLYRLATAEEIETAGLWEAFCDSSGLIFIEWPSRISENDLPLDWQILQIEFIKISETKRLFKLSRLFS